MGNSLYIRTSPFTMALKVVFLIDGWCYGVDEVISGHGDSASDDWWQPLSFFDIKSWGIFKGMDTIWLAFCLRHVVVVIILYSNSGHVSVTIYWYGTGQPGGQIRVWRAEAEIEDGNKTQALQFEQRTERKDERGNNTMSNPWSVILVPEVYLRWYGILRCAWHNNWQLLKSILKYSLRFKHFTVCPYGLFAVGAYQRKKQLPFRLWTISMWTGLKWHSGLKSRMTKDVPNLSISTVQGIHR
jgi:hypothetical protein